jgi:hypothetical protein
LNTSNLFVRVSVSWQNKSEVLADQLFLLMDGAYMASRMFGAKSTKNPAVHVAEAARILIDSALG